MSNKELKCFKAYDVRGRVPDDLDEGKAFEIGRGFANFLKQQNNMWTPSYVAVGRDARLSSVPLSKSFKLGIEEEGLIPVDIGLCGTEHVYFATFYYKFAGGAMITASHNPIEYNGIKMVRQDAIPISKDTGLQYIKNVAEKFYMPQTRLVMEPNTLNVMPDYINYILKFIDVSKLKPLKVVCNIGNGAASDTIKALEPRLPLRLEKVLEHIDPTFPHGVPNPLIPANQELTSEAVKRTGADFGVAWDGDFDRCFFFDEKGQFIDGYYLVGLFADYFLQKESGGKIVYDPRAIWNTEEMIRNAGGINVINRGGHSFIKQRMREEDSIYAGEMSAHHYFRNFGYSDSGMIPWLIMAQIISESGKTLSELIGDKMDRYPVSGEINTTVDDSEAALKYIEEYYTLEYKSTGYETNYVDGLSMDFGPWRFNLRPSNTEPLLRLNVESKANKKLVEEKTKEILYLLEGKK